MVDPVVKNPVLKKLLEYLSTSVPPLIHGEDHVDYVETRPPIEYDYHMPTSLQPQKVAHDPLISSTLTKHLISTLEERTFIKDESMDIAAIKATFRIRNLVPREAVGETCVGNVQKKIHGISCPLATLSCFDIQNDDIEQFSDVFGANESSQSNTKADLLIGCQPREQDKAEAWAPLWSDVTQPKDLRDRYFRTLYTEEFKNIRAGGPRAILGIYVIMWCLRKGYLANFWPENDCDGCLTFRKSHDAIALGDDEFDGEPLDAPGLTTPETTPRLLKKEVNRLLVLADEYDARYKIPVKPQGTVTNRRQRKDSDVGIVEELKSYKQRLRAAMHKASRDLEFSETIKDGLLHWVLNAAYMLIQVWSQMVRHNGTVARLTCHNLGVIITRHREDKTMAVSDFFEHTDTPILQTTALTVYAYHDAVERHDKHLAKGVPLWVADPYRGETSADRKAAETGTDVENDDGGEDQGPPKGGKKGGGGGSGKRGPGGGGTGGGAGSGGGDDGGTGGTGGAAGDRAADGGGTMNLDQARQERRDNRDKASKANLNALHLAFRAPGSHLRSKGFSHFERIDYQPPSAGPDPVDEHTPRAQDDPSAYFGVLLAQSTSGQQRRASAGSAHSSRSDSTHTSVPSLFSEHTSSVPTSPSAGSFTDASSRDSSPHPEKSAGRPVDLEHSTSATVVQNAGVVIDRVLGESVIGIVWSGKMILENGTEDDTLIPVAVKMAVPRDNTDGEAKDDEREAVRHEASMYEFLARSGKLTIAPRSYGVFEDAVGTVALVLDNAGTALKSFKTLTGEQARTLFAMTVEMHSVGIVHGDLVPRNVVMSSEGELRTIDFHVANIGHRCSGAEQCKELVEFSRALGL